MFHKEAFPLPLPPAPAESVKTKTPPISGFQRPYFSKTVGKKWKLQPVYPRKMSFSYSVGRGD